MGTPDGGPIYSETQWDWWIKEPLNTVTAFSFFLLAVYHLWRLKKPNAFLVSSLWILIIGGIGGTLFHGLRTSRWFLFFDFMPILILVLRVSLYLWRRVRGVNGYWILPLFVAVQFAVWGILPRKVAVNFGYANLAIMILFPLGIVLSQEKFQGAKYVGLSAGSFFLALLCRSIDPLSRNIAVTGYTPGTHWLWHIFGVISVHFLILFLKNLSPREV